MKPLIFFCTALSLFAQEPSQNRYHASDMIIPLDEILPDRGTLMITRPHKDITIYVNGTLVQPVEGSLTVVMNGLKPGIYEVKAVSSKTTTSMVSIRADEVTSLSLKREHNRNYFCVTPSWGVLAGESLLSAGPSVDFSWIINNRVYLGADWNVQLYETKTESMAIGGMFHFGSYKPFTSLIAGELGMNLGLVYQDDSFFDSYDYSYYDQNGTYYPSETSHSKDYFYFTGLHTAGVIGKGVFNCRLSYDLMLATDFSVGHLLKLGLMMKF